MSDGLIPLRLGAFQVPDFLAVRSGIRWLRDDGYRCRPGEAIAFCQIGLAPTSQAAAGRERFVDEALDLQVVFAPRIAGRLLRQPQTSQGGFLDKLSFLAWDPDGIIAHIEPEPGQQPASMTAGELLLTIVTGRRFTEAASDIGGLLSGWHDRRRGWRADDGAAFGTVLSLGICEQAGIVRGERGAFLEMLDAASGPAHIVHSPDESLVPSSPVLIDQLRRTPAQREEIADDFARTFAAGPIVPSPKDWLFTSAMMAMLLKSPLTEHYDLLTRSRLTRTGPAEAVMLSVLAELSTVLRHKRLGYHVSFHDFHLRETGPAVPAWLRAQFEPVRRTPDQIFRDLSTLVAEAGPRFVILNALSSSGYEAVDNYAAFDRPIGDTIASVRSKELNVMLYDLARERGVSIVDIDQIAAEMGALHCPDGVHQSGALQDEIRAEIVQILRARRVPGFAAPVSSFAIL